MTIPDIGDARPKSADPPPWIRTVVRDVLQRAPHYHSLPTPDRTALAQAMVKVSALAAELISEESQAQSDIERQNDARLLPPLARAQDQPNFGASSDRIADTTRNVLNAVSFPRFVTDLVNGVFRAMLDSSAQQMQQYVQLLNAVSASADGFERTQFDLTQIRHWVAEHFPESIEFDQPLDDEESDPEELANTRLRLRAGASMPSAEEIRTTLGVSAEESVDVGNPEQLVPLARRHLARQRQQMLATMVMLGMQRIVIDSGRINAAMRFHVDTRSAANEDRGSQFSMQNRVKASGGFHVGPWGASAEIENNIGYVSTQRTQNSEEMNTDLDLNSSVELNFHSDYLPLNQVAAQAQADRIRRASLNPAAEFPDPATSRNARLQSQLQSERDRRGGITESIVAANRPAPAPPSTGGATTDPAASGRGNADDRTSRPATRDTPTATNREGSASPASPRPESRATTTPANSATPATGNGPGTDRAPNQRPSSAAPTDTPPATSGGTTPATNRQ